MNYVYLLKSLKDNKQYIGSTKNIAQRLKEHNRGNVKSTKYRRPLICIGYQKFNTIKIAAAFEKKYKKSSSNLQRAIKKKQFIINSIGE